MYIYVNTDIHIHCPFTDKVRVIPLGSVLKEMGPSVTWVVDG